jgi:hypothetical protein
LIRIKMRGCGSLQLVLRSEVYSIALGLGWLGNRCAHTIQFGGCCVVQVIAKKAQEFVDSVVELVELGQIDALRVAVSNPSSKLQQAVDYWLLWKLKF